METDRDVLVDATFVGPHAAELLHAATIAVTAEVPTAVLWHAVPAFPTLREAWLLLLDQLHGDTPAPDSRKIGPVASTRTSDGG